jgi:glycosyltransferase involved in cell wall biosynthesis
MTPKLGVCMISTFFYPFAGGAEKQGERLSTWLVQHGVPVTIITRQYDDLPTHEVLNGIEIYRIRTLPGKGLTALSFALGGVWTLLRHRKRFNVIHTHQIYSPTTIGWIGKRLLNHPLVINLHLGGKEGDIQRLLRNPRSGKARLEGLKRDGDAFIAISNEILNELREQDVPEEKIHVLGNAVDPNVFKPVSPEEKKRLREKLGLPLNAPIVVIVARVVEIKGHAVLLKAWADVPAPAHLVIIGTGDLEESLKAQADAQMPGRVTFTGKRDNVNEYLQAADAWTLPSYGEGLPVSLLEAMSAGLPVVVTPVGAMPEIVQDGVNGFIVPVGNDAALAAALTNAIDGSKESLNLGRRGRELIEAQYSIDSVSQAYLDLFSKLVK